LPRNRASRARIFSGFWPCGEYGESHPEREGGKSTKGKRICGASRPLCFEKGAVMDAMVDEAALMPKDAALEDLQAAVAAYNAARPKVTRDMYINVTLILGVYLLFSVLLLYLVATQIEADWTFITLGVL